MGRRWGKTILGGCVVSAVLSQHGKAAWIAPTYKNSRPLWRWLAQMLAPASRKGLIRISASDRTIETKQGGYLALYSGDNIDAIRGESFHVVVLDEAARLGEEAWTDAIEPTLADYDGDAIIISTPKGKNWFYVEFSKGVQGADGYASWQAPTAANPNPNIQKAARLAAARVPELTYQQEWLAQFVDSGLVFRKIREAIGAVRQEGPISGHEYVIGVDWAKRVDRTVFTVIDLNTSEVVHIDRMNRTDYLLQLDRLKRLNDLFQPVEIIAESNSVADPLLEMLWRENLPVRGFMTTSRSKANLIEALISAFEEKKIKIPDDPMLISELESFEATPLATGVRYAAPEGLHDDHVMSLAFAWDGAKYGKIEITPIFQKAIV